MSLFFLLRLGLSKEMKNIGNGGKTERKRK
jgi:hypothetical protein